MNVRMLPLELRLEVVHFVGVKSVEPHPFIVEFRRIFDWLQENYNSRMMYACILDLIRVRKRCLALTIEFHPDDFKTVHEWRYLYDVQFRGLWFPHDDLREESYRNWPHQPLEMLVD